MLIIGPHLSITGAFTKAGNFSWKWSGLC